MNRPKLFPEESIAPKNTRRLTSIGIILYTLYLIPLAIGFFLLLEPPQGLDAATDQLFIIFSLLVLIVIDILLPLRFLRKTYANGLTRYRSLTNLIVPTLIGIRVVYFAPVAIYNILLVAYFYYLANFTNTDTTPNTTTNQDTSKENTPINHSAQRKSDDIEENAYKKNKNQE